MREWEILGPPLSFMSPRRTIHRQPPLHHIYDFAAIAIYTATRRRKKPLFVAAAQRLWFTGPPLLRKYGVEDEQELKYCCGFKARITSMSLKRYSPLYIIAIGLMTILP